MEINTIIDNLFTALWYDYSKDYVISTIHNVVSMVEHIGTRNCTEFASYIFKVLVLSYGDYGVAPAVGWIEDKYKEDILTAIEKWCKDMRIFESEDE